MLAVARPAGNELNRLLNACNRTCENFNQPTLYATNGDSPPAKRQRRSSGTSSNDLPDRSDAFHFSLAWNLDGSTIDFKKRKRFADVSKVMETSIAPLRVRILDVKLKVGNAIASIALQSTAARASASILGR